MKRKTANKESQPTRGSKKIAGKKPATVSSTAHTGVLTAKQKVAVTEITRQHDELREATRLTLGKAIKLGERLAKLRDDVGHGGWLLFVRRNLPFCDKTAERYIKVYEHQAVLLKFDTVSNLTLSGAYELLTKQKAKTPDDPRNEEAEESDSDAAEVNTLVTGISRTVCDGLERLSPTQLRDFETAVLEFKDNWLLHNAPEAAQ